MITNRIKALSRATRMGYEHILFPSSTTTTAGNILAPE